MQVHGISHTLPAFEVFHFRTYSFLHHMCKKACQLSTYAYFPLVLQLILKKNIKGIPNKRSLTIFNSRCEHINFHTAHRAPPKQDSAQLNTEKSAICDTPSAVARKALRPVQTSLVANPSAGDFSFACACALVVVCMCMHVSYVCMWVYMFCVCICHEHACVYVCMNMFSAYIYICTYIHTYIHTYV
jgi:hypothetical protein